MLRIRVFALGCLALGLRAASVPPSMMAANSRLRFEPADGDRYIATGIRYQFAFAPHSVMYRTGATSGRLEFAGALKSATLSGIERLATVSNRFTGNDASQWRTGIANYARLQVAGL